MTNNYTTTNDTTNTNTTINSNSKKIARTALDEIGGDGSFKRTPSKFVSKIEPGGRFEPEAERYHLYVALACPWAAGTLAALKHKGLDGIVGVSVVHSTWGKTNTNGNDNDPHCGWHFRNPGDDPVTNSLGYGSFECDDALVPDTVNGAKTVRELYQLANDTSGKYTTPILWCKKENTIVNNESLQILKILDESFAGVLRDNGKDNGKDNDRCLFPPKLQAQAEEWNELIYNTVNNGVYKCGFAKSQAAYETAHKELFATLDKLEAHFGEQKSNSNSSSNSGPPLFLMGTQQPTWLDIRLYMTLVRFDPVYVVYFKCSHKKIGDSYPNLLEYIRTCYQRVPAIREATNMRHIKMHYFSSHPILNAYGIIPVSNGPSLTEGWEDKQEKE